MTAKHKRKRGRRPAGRGQRSRQRVPATPEGRLQRIPVWRLWVYRVLAATLVPLTFLALVEAALRVGGYGYPTPAMVRAEDREAYRDNRQFSWRFFPRKLARSPVPYRFEAEKPDDTCRIFILGASAAKGTPDPAFAFSRILEVMLQERFPGVRFEVINTSIVATNSHVVRRIAIDSAHHDPDLFIVYLGNNEVVGPYGAGTVFTPLSENLPLIRLGIALGGTRIGQLLSNTAGSLQESRSPAEWAGMEMFLEKQVRHDDPSLQAVYEHFESNLGDIREVARRAGAGVIFSSVGINLGDSPPFASAHRRDLSETETARWRAHYDDGVAHEKNRAFGEAVRAYLSAATIDPTFADLQFRLATCHRQQGDPGRATEHYVRACDYDTLRFRADSRINRIIRSVAVGSGEGVRFADAAGALRAASPDGIPGQAHFHEHVHLKFEGNYVVARTILPQIESLLPTRFASRRNPEARLLTEAECRQRLVYTLEDECTNAWTVLNVFFQRPPFTNQLHHESRVRELRERFVEMERKRQALDLRQIDAQFEKALEMAPHDWWLHRRYGSFLLTRQRDAQAAVRELRLARDLMPHSSWTHAKLGEAMGILGDLDAAVSLNLEAVRLEPSNTIAHYNLGLACQMRDEPGKAMEHYETALSHDPRFGKAHNNRAILLLREGRVDAAMEAYRKALEIVTDCSELHLNLGLIYRGRGRRAEAEAEFRNALRIDPVSSKLHEALRSVVPGKPEPRPVPPSDEGRQNSG